MNVSTRETILGQVKKIVTAHLPHQTKVYLFGSWSRSEEKNSSDIDVAIEFQSNVESNRRVLMDVRHALEESTIPYRVDLVDLNEADDSFVQKVRMEGILWDVQANE